MSEPQTTGPEPTTAPEITHEQIARLAYQIWEDNNRIPGSEIENWLAAERVLQAELG